MNPTHEEVTKRTVDRLKSFTERLESGELIEATAVATIRAKYNAQDGPVSQEFVALKYLVEEIRKLPRAYRDDVLYWLRNACVADPYITDIPLRKAAHTLIHGGE